MDHGESKPCGNGAANAASPIADDGAAPAGVSGTRRRLLVGGLIAAPAILTLSSRSALANHCSISGMMSGNLSKPHDATCQAMSPQFWRNNPDRWPMYTAGPGDLPRSGLSFGASRNHTEPTDEEWRETAWKEQTHQEDSKGDEEERDRHRPRGTRISEVFGSGIARPSELTMMQALWLAENGPTPLIAHAVAALLNAHYFGAEQFGIEPEVIIKMVKNRAGSDPLGLLADLERLNNRR